MNKSFLALALALGVIPIAALAQDTSAAPPTDAQHQAISQTVQRYAQQEKQLHDQMRLQILSSLTPVQRRAVGATIGELAVAENPDVKAAAQRLDSLLSPGERQRIMTAHSAFATQSKQLRDQMRAELQSEMPAGHPPMGDHGMMNGQRPSHRVDAGWILLGALLPHGHGMMGMHPGP